MGFPKRFENLPKDEQKRVRAAGTQMGELAFQHCAAVLIASPADIGPGQTNNGSAFVLKLQNDYFLGTAWHVVQEWFLRTANGERLLFQVGHADFPPRNRVAWHDETDDVVFLSIDANDVKRIGIVPTEPIRGWPPPRPSVGDALLVAGYPGSLRDFEESDGFEFGSFTASFRVTSVHERYLICQFERENWIADEHLEIPPQGAPLGGMSGGPAFLIQELVYPLVGLISEHSSAFELMRITTLAHVPGTFRTEAV